METGVWDKASFSQVRECQSLECEETRTVLGTTGLILLKGSHVTEG